METYFDRNGKLLPKFYQDPKWKVMGSILLTVFDCTCCIATWGFAIYLMFWKSVFLIACSFVSPCSGSVDRSKEKMEKERTERYPTLQTPGQEHLQESRPSTPDSKAHPAASKSEESTRAITPEIGKSRESERKLRKISVAKLEAGWDTRSELNDAEDGL